jgi:hypothetical protein
MQRDNPHAMWSPTTDERTELRREAGEAWRFVGGDHDGDGRESPWVGPLDGEAFILVPPRSPARPWHDPAARIGSCVLHKEHSPREPLTDDPCAFRVNSYFVSAHPQDLYIALFLDWLAARPEMPRRLVWKSVLRWRVMRLRLEEVRVAYMTGRDAERFLPGGEPMLRHSETTWGYLRWAHTRQHAALVIVESDPAGSRVASRLLMFCHAVEALCEAGALEAEAIEVRPRRWPRPGARGGDGRRLLPRLLLPTPGKRPRVGQGYDALTRIWASHRRSKSRRRKRRRDRWSAMREIAIRELALNEENSDVRFRTRVQLVTTIKMARSVSPVPRCRLRFVVPFLVSVGYGFFHLLLPNILS